MKEFLIKIKNHPGLKMAIIMSCLLITAAFTNKSFTTLTEVIIVSLISVGFIWLIVIYSILKKD